MHGLFVSSAIGVQLEERTILTLMVLLGSFCASGASMCGASKLFGGLCM